MSKGLHAIRMDDALWERIDKEATKKHVTASEMVRIMCADYLGCMTNGYKVKGRGK